MATTIKGALGADTITGINGADILMGGVGNNIYIVKSLLNVIVEPTSGSIGSYQPYYSGNAFAASGGIDTIQTNVLDSLKTYSLEKSAYVENLTYTGVIAAQLKGNSNNNVIKANAAAVTNDTLYGVDGNDSLYGYGGKDMLQGGQGDDLFDGGAGTDADTLIGGTGNDTYLNITSADIVIEVLNSGFDTVSTNAAGGKYLDLRTAQLVNIEGLIYNSSVGGALHGNNADNSISSTNTSGNDTLNGWSGNDTLKGGGGNDSLIGGVGDDDLTGGYGADTLTGGSGNDIYFVDTLDVVKELSNDGVDTFVGTKTSIAVTAYASTIENLIYTGTVGANIIGNGFDNWIGGGNGNDTIAAGAGNDKIIGGAGRDVLQGGAGDDMLYGGSVVNLQTRALLNFQGATSTTVDDNVADTLVGGAGSDKYVIDNSLDVITEVATDTGTDVIVSSIDISLNAYSNIEALVLDDNLAASTAWFAEGNTGNNIIIGNNNENYISGDAGNDTLTGDMDGSGTPSGYYGYSPVTDVVDGGDGDDVLMALASVNLGYMYDYIMGKSVSYANSYSSNTSNVLMGGSGNDFYLLQNDKTAIYDSLGTDTVYLMTSASLEAAEGVDRIVLAGGNTTQDAIAMAALDKVKSVGGDNTVNTLVTSLAVNATGNALKNIIYGNVNNNLLRGLGGNDSLLGGAGNDTLDGGAGADTLVGGAGDDTYVDVSTGDVITETATGGVDWIRSATLTALTGFTNIEGLEFTGATGVLLQNGTANTSIERFIGGAGNDTLNGWGGNDNLSGGAGNDSLSGGDGDDVLQGGSGADTVSGGLGNDTINGSGDLSIVALDLKNTLYGGAGNDSMTGGNGVDLMYGEADNDMLAGGQGADRLDGGAGNDQLYAGASSYDNSDTSANLLTGGAGNDTLYGSGGNDTLSGGSENDYLTGSTGNDSLSGDTGLDTLYGGAGDDVLNGGAENDQLTGDAGNDSLIGGDGDDNLYGSEGNDTLNGGAGNDRLEGGSGDDILYAGEANIFGRGDNLIGDWLYGNFYETAGKDIFRFESTAASASQLEFIPMGGARTVFNKGHFIDDFTKLDDKIQFAKTMTGDGDALLENVATKAAAGGTFANTAEMVIVQADLTTDFTNSYSYGGYWNPISASEVVDAIGQADAAFAIGDKRLFVVDDGISSALFQFTSAGADATVSEAELKLIGVVDGQASLSSSDFGLY
jgi:Ca2+-binding RTX toxin-like protein